MITRRTVSVRSRLTAGAAVIALAASACGGDNSGGGTAEGWCDFLQKSDEVDKILDALGSDPGAVETGLREVESIAKELKEVAPSEIADDAKVVADGALTLVDAFADANFNIVDVDLAILSDTELEAERDASGDALDAFSQRECGRSFGQDDAGSDDDANTDESGDSEGSGDFDPSNGTLRDQLISQFESIGLTQEESSCIAGNLDFADPAVQSGDIGAMLSVFEECEIGLDRLAQLGGG